MRAFALAIIALSFTVLAARADAPAQPAQQSDPAASFSFDPAKGVPGVFERRADGSIHHLQSGLVCPAKYPNTDFYNLLVYAADGSDVGCDYRRADDKGGAWSKLTIFATKAPVGATIDQAFARFRNELTTADPDAQPQGPAAQIENPGTETKPPFDFQSEEFLIQLNEQTYTTQLFVTVSNGWMIEIRTTFVGLPNAVSASREGANSAVEEVGDRVMGIRALMDAMGSIGR